VYTVTVLFTTLRYHVVVCISARTSVFVMVHIIQLVQQTRF